MRAPAYRGDSAIVTIIGEILIYAKSVTVNFIVLSDNMNVAVPIERSRWYTGTDGYYCDYSLDIYIDGKFYRTVDGRFTLPLGTNGAVTSLSFTPTLAKSGGVVEITLNGPGLELSTSPVSLWADCTGTMITAVVSKENGIYTARLSVPQNITGSPQSYTLYVTLNGENQTLIGNRTLTVTTASAVSPFDLNSDGAVNILDMIIIGKRILS